MIAAIRTTLLVTTGLALLTAAPAMSQGKGGPKGKDTTSSARSYYLTTVGYNGSGAPSACAPGYHLASVYELLNFSTFSYETALGASRDDSGSGPPAGMVGWVRTGWNASGSGPAGTANCQAYTSQLGSEAGTALTLRFDLSSDNLDTLVRPWLALTYTCDLALPAWCVED